MATTRIRGQQLNLTGSALLDRGITLTADKSIGAGTSTAITFSNTRATVTGSLQLIKTTPTADAEVASKAYVDSQTGGSIPVGTLAFGQYDGTGFSGDTNLGTNRLLSTLNDEQKDHSLSLASASIFFARSGSQKIRNLASGSLLFDIGRMAFTGSALPATGSGVQIHASNANGYVDISGGSSGHVRIEGVRVTDSTVSTAAGDIKVEAEAADAKVTIKGDHESGTAIHIDGDANAASIVDIDAGILNIDASDNIVVAAADLISFTTSDTGADGKISLVSGVASANTSIHLDGNAAAGSIVDIDAGVLDIDATGAVTIDSSAGTIGIGVDAVDQNINIGTDGARTISIGSEAAGNTAAINMKALGAADSDVSIESAAGSVNITGGEAAADSVNISGTGVTIASSNTTHGVKLATATSGVPISIGHTTSLTTVNDDLTVTGHISGSSTVTVGAANATQLQLKNGAIGVGHDGTASDKDLMELTSGVLTVNGHVSGTTFTVGAANGTQLQLKNGAIGVGHDGTSSDPDLIQLDDGAATFNGAVTVNGNFNVLGTATAVSSSNLMVSDPIIALGVSGTSLGQAGDRGIVMAMDKADQGSPSFFFDFSGIPSSGANEGTVTGSFVFARSVSTGSALTLEAASYLGLKAQDAEFGPLGGSKLRLGVAAAGEIDTSAGNLTLDSAGGTVVVDDALQVASTIGVSGDSDLMTLASNVLTVAGHVSGTTVTVGAANATQLQFKNGAIGVGHDGTASDKDLMELTSGILTVNGHLSGTTATVGAANATQLQFKNGAIGVGHDGTDSDKDLMELEKGILTVNGHLSGTTATIGAANATQLQFKNGAIGVGHDGNDSDKDLMELTSGILTVNGHVSGTTFTVGAANATQLQLKNGNIGIGHDGAVSDPDLLALTSGLLTVNAGATIVGALQQSQGTIVAAPNGASSISTSAGNLTLDSAATLNLGTTNATALVLGNTGNTTAISAAPATTLDVSNTTRLTFPKYAFNRIGATYAAAAQTAFTVFEGQIAGQIVGNTTFQITGSGNMHVRRGSLEVYLNGLLLHSGSGNDYTMKIVGGGQTCISGTLNSGLISGDVLTVKVGLHQN